MFVTDEFITQEENLKLELSQSQESSVKIETELEPNFSQNRSPEMIFLSSDSEPEFENIDEELENVEELENPIIIDSCLKIFLGPETLEITEFQSKEVSIIDNKSLLSNFQAVEKMLKNVKMLKISSLGACKQRESVRFAFSDVFHRLRDYS